MAFAAAASSSKQQVVLCSPNCIKVYETSIADTSTEASSSELQSESEEMEVDIADFRLKEEKPPYVIVVHGPPKVGKSTLIRSLEHHCSKGKLKSSVYKNLLTIISGEQRRIQFVECPNSVNGMLDAAKYADAVILLINTYVSFQVETFEFVNILRVHGMPKVMGALTYLDLCKTKVVSERIAYIMHNFRAQICEGAKVFALSKVKHGMYPKDEILDLATFISDMEFHPLPCRSAQPYILADRYEDVTPHERVVMDNKCDREIVLYGYLRGCDIKKGTKVHIAGVDDFPLVGVTESEDPCPLKACLRRKRSYEDEENIENEGFKPGTYLRLELGNVPYNMVVNYDHSHPILVGGVEKNTMCPEEETVTPEEDTTNRKKDLPCIQVLLERHSWHNKLLKSRNPIIISIGWRRYVANPIYAKADCSGRLEMIHSTPVNEQCMAIFRGPFASPFSGVVIAQSVPENKAPFRILATGVVVPCDQGHQGPTIWWKCKRRGTACKISGKTALIKGLFRSDDAINSIEDTKLWTERGMQGKVKMVVGKHDGQGIACCKFKGKLLMTDKVFMRTWQELVPPPSPNQSPAFDLVTDNNMPKLEIQEEDTEGLGIKEKDKKGLKIKEDPHMKRQFEGVRTVRFFLAEPPFCVQDTYEKLTSRYCNMEEQREFAKFPCRVISKEEEMFVKLEGRKRKKNALEDFKKTHYFSKIRGQKWYTQGIAMLSR